MICKVIEAIERYDMLCGGTVVVGLSGGADSVALLHILCTLRKEYGIEIVAAHVNHMLRGDESERDRAFVESLCDELQVPLKLLCADVSRQAADNHIGLEECGRRIRYDFFESIPCARIATAHTLSDRIETQLLNLSRGASLSGLCSIPPKRGKIIRPLILCTSAEVRQYCADNSLSYVTDSSNLSDDYARNRVRHKVVPVLCEINSGFENNAARCIESLETDNALISSLTDSLLLQSKTDRGYDARKLSEAHSSLKRRALYRILFENSGVMPERKHIEEADRLLSCSGSAQLCGSIICRVSEGELTFPKQTNIIPEWRVEAKLGKNITSVGNYILQIISKDRFKSLSYNEKRCCFDADAAGEGLVFRSRTAGDTFTDSRRHVSKTVKKLFNEAKIPSEKRNEVCILACESGAVWIDGHGVSALYEVKEKTKRIILITQE